MFCFVLFFAWGLYYLDGKNVQMSSPKWPITSLSIFARSAARTSKPVAGSVEAGGNHVLYLLAKARALKRAAVRSRVQES